MNEVARTKVSVTRVFLHNGPSRAQQNSQSEIGTILSAQFEAQDSIKITSINKHLTVHKQGKQK